MLEVIALMGEEEIFLRENGNNDLLSHHNKSPWAVPTRTWSSMRLLMSNVVTGENLKLSATLALFDLDNREKSSGAVSLGKWW